MEERPELVVERLEGFLFLDEALRQEEGLVDQASHHLGLAPHVADREGVVETLELGLDGLRVDRLLEDFGHELLRLHHGLHGGQAPGLLGDLLRGG